MEKQKPHEAQHREVHAPALGAPQAPAPAGAAWLEGPGEPGGQEVKYDLDSHVHQSLKQPVSLKILFLESKCSDRLNEGRKGLLFTAGHETTYCTIN